MQSRREFLSFGALALAGYALASNPARSPFMVEGLRIGVQMYSIDDLWRKNPAAAFRRLKAMGYDGVQSSGFFKMDWGELAKMLDGEGLAVVDMSVPEARIKTTAEFDRFVDFCHTFKVDFAFLPWADPKTPEAEWRALAGRLAELSKRFAAVGIRMGFHNHQVEFTTKFADGTCPFDLFERAGIDFELDVGHARLAGADPVALLKRLKGRVPSIHAKPAGGPSIGGKEDLNDWASIFTAAAAAGTKWAIVECETERNTFAHVESSAKFLRDLGTRSRLLQG